MQRLAVAVFSVFVAANLGAVQPQQWRTDTTEEFLGGEVDGFAITSRGELVPSPHSQKMATFPDPFVLSQAEDGAGTRYFGTGNNGNVYRLRKGELDVIFKAAEPEVYAMVWSDGFLWVGTSPHGKLYRIDTTRDESREWFDPDAAYIWGVTAAGTGRVFVTTGLPGRLYAVTGEGKAESWFEAPEGHLRSIAVREDGSVLVGGSGQGRIYEARGPNEVRAIFDSDLQEISAIYSGTAGTSWAAGVTNVLPQTAPPQTTQQTAGQQTGQAAQEPSPEPQATAAVDFTFSFENGVPGAPTGGSSELYRIAPDGYAERVWKFDSEMIYGIAPAEGEGLYLSTGPQGRIYEFLNGEISLVTTLPEKQVVSFSGAGGVVTTTNSGAVYRLDEASTKNAEYRSKIKDTGTFSRFGHFLVEGKDLESSGIKMSFRSGNTATPDSTWSQWKNGSGPSGQIGAPRARYLQWKLEAEKPSRSMRVDSVSAVYVNRNAAPVIEAVTVNDPGVIFLTTGYPQAPQIVESTNPDENGIFTGLEPAPSAQRNDPGKRYFRKGYRTFTWRARDPNGDQLDYELSFRRAGGTSWLLLRKAISDIQFNFDTTQLPDGEYEIRIVASDAAANQDAPLRDVKEGLRFVVDNTPPVIESKASGSDVVIRISDSASPVSKVEYAVDAAKWIQLDPEDGIADSRLESFRIPREKLVGQFVMIRAVDAFYNVATATVQTTR